jgi:hypothetical protein
VQLSAYQTDTKMIISNPMKFIVILILIISLLSCKEKKEIKELSKFESIECSFYFGDFQSIKILSNGATSISDSSRYTGTKFYSTKLDSSILDSLSKMINLLVSIKLDSIYQAPAADHPFSFALIIKTRETTVLTSYFGDQNETQWKSLFHLSNYLRGLCKKETEHVDSTFKFKSISRLILPPPPPPRPK